MAWQESTGEGGLQESDPRRAVESARPARAVPGLFLEVLHISEVAQEVCCFIQQLACFVPAACLPASYYTVRVLNRVITQTTFGKFLL